MSWCETRPGERFGVSPGSISSFFQGLVAVPAGKRWPDLIAFECKKDVGAGGDAPVVREAGEEGGSGMVIRIGRKGTRVKQPMWKAIAGDSHFWIPVAVLALGTGLLAVLR